MATRQAMVRVLRGNKVSFSEVVTLNEKNRITIHNHPMDAIIDEGPKGRRIEEIYRDVEEVVFTTKKHTIPNRNGQRLELPLVIIIATPEGE